MSELKKIVIDDEDDTLLFKKLQEHVLEHYPNPERIGCFDHETLTTFVETPGRLDLEDPKYLHIFECAECTRELIELRRLREERTAQIAESQKGGAARIWQWAGIAAAITLIAAVSFISLRFRSNHPAEMAKDLAPVSVLIDLSADGVARGTDQASSGRPVRFPARRVDLRLVLPYYSPAGNYRITITEDRSQSRVQASGSAVAAANGAHTELTIPLDLSHLLPGRYYLGTAREGDGGPYYYPAVIQE